MSPARRAGRTTRRGLFTGALGRVQALRESLPDAPERTEARGDSRRTGPRSYRDGVASARRRERQAPAAQPAVRAPRSWREGAAEVTATKPPASRTVPG